MNFLWTNQSTLQQEWRWGAAIRIPKIVVITTAESIVRRVKNAFNESPHPPIIFTLSHIKSTNEKDANESIDSSKSEFEDECPPGTLLEEGNRVV